MMRRQRSFKARLFYPSLVLSAKPNGVEAFMRQAGTKARPSLWAAEVQEREVGRCRRGDTEAEIGVRPVSVRRNVRSCRGNDLGHLQAGSERLDATEMSAGESHSTTYLDADGSDGRNVTSAVARKLSSRSTVSWTVSNT